MSTLKMKNTPTALGPVSWIFHQLTVPKSCFYKYLVYIKRNQIKWFGFWNTACLARLLKKSCQDKTSIKNEHLRNVDYFAITAFCSHSIFLTNYAKTKMVGAPYRVWKIYWWVLTLSLKPYILGNFTLSFGRLRRRILLKCVLSIYHLL